MAERKKLRLGDLLIQSGYATEDQIAKGLEIQKNSQTRRKLGEVLVEENIVNEEDLVNALSSQLGYEAVDLQSIQIDDRVIELIPASVLQKHKMMPIGFAEDNPNEIVIAMSDPMDIFAMDDVTIITNLQVRPAVATTRSIMLALDRFYGDASISDSLADYEKSKDNEMQETEEMYSEDVINSPIVQLVKSMIESAVRQRTSDIHIEPTEKRVRIRYRIDGALYEKANYSIKLMPAISARIKIIGGMDIAEKRKPQDGRITQIVDRMEYDIRVSVLPTCYGEKIVMRLTSKTALSREKSQLGLDPDEMKKFDHILANPHGIILVTGPTGSGKSTTLYTALSELNKEDVNIITVEDPVEANIDGINQVMVNPKAGLTFASALRSILRQDPDIIMIGEIRDGETAAIAVQASITGHLVVSTLHTNSAASTISRLADMGIEPYLIADATVGVIAQRLVRRLCPDCKRKKEASLEEKKMMRIKPEYKVPIYEPVGCVKCNNTGYKGRIGCYEIMEVSPAIKSVISKGGQAEEIKQVALKEGMRTLRMSATKYVVQGITSFSEMVRISFEG